jgi:hypothetical protein
MVFAFDQAWTAISATTSTRPTRPTAIRRRRNSSASSNGAGRLCRALGFAVLADERYEADDLIGSALQALRQAGLRGVVISGDKDLAQLLEARTSSGTTRATSAGTCTG